MNESRRSSATSWVDPDDAPEWTIEEWAGAEIAVGDKVVRPGAWRKPGRPPLGEHPKRQVTLRLDPDVLDRFRADGPGWQGRINEALRKAVGL